MAPADSFWSRIRKGRLVQVLLVYLGVSWAILEGVDLLRDTFQLPPWVGPTTSILLVVGLLVMLATAWVQSHPLVDRREATEEVPSSWELDLGELTGSIRQGHLPHLTWARALLGGVFAFSLLIGLAGLYVLLQDRGRSLAPDPLVAGEAAPGIAVLPFDVRGPGAEGWREGMVDVLAKSLDGAAGLRTIESRTVLARWREGVRGDSTPDVATALEVAGRTGARYAVLGSVVIAGDRLRAIANVYELETGGRLGEAQVDGPADSIFAVVDRFSGEVLRRIVGGRGEIPKLDLARATTASVPALKAYLEGEVHLRRSEFDDAVEAYQRAVAADSNFALAWLRLGLASGWFSPPNFGLVAEAYGRAVRLSGRLPERDALLARAGFDSPEALEALRTATRKYPDDPLAWYLLGDFVFHQGGALLADPEERRRSFERAIELDPRFSPAYLHAIHNTMRTDPDSGRVSELVDAYSRLAPGTAEVREFRLVQALAFGDDSTRQRALAALDTLSGVPLWVTAGHALRHPRFLEPMVAVFEAARAREDPFEAGGGAFILVQARFDRGEVQTALEAADHPRIESSQRAQLVYVAHVSGLPIPTDKIAQAVSQASTDEIALGERANWTHFYRGAWALERGRPDEYKRSRVALQQMVEEATVKGDSIAARQLRGAARGLEGFVAWREGRTDQAERALDEARLETVGGPYAIRPNRIIRWWLSELALESGRLEDAAELLLSLSHGEAYQADPIATLRLAHVQEQLSRLKEARANYEWFVLAWRYADPKLQPMVEDAKARLLRLMDDIGQ